MTDAKSATLRWGLSAFAGGSGLGVAIAAMQVVKARPEFLPQLLTSGPLAFTAFIVMMVMFHRQFAQFNATNERHAVAQEEAAKSFAVLAEKIGARDEAAEQRARENELTLNHLARQNEQILAELKRIQPAV